MNTKYLKLLEKYFNGEMTDEEKLGFENSLTLDPGLDAAYKEYQRILEAIQDKEALDLRRKLMEIREGSMRSGRGRSFFEHGNNLIWLAALLIIVICLTIVASQLIEQQRLRNEYTSVGKIEMITGFSALDKELVKYGMRNEHFILELPADQPILDKDDELCFQWQVDSSFALVLDIISGSGKIVHSSRKPAHSPYCLRKKLPVGFYVFRFRSQTEAFYQGVIYLR